MKKLVTIMGLSELTGCNRFQLLRLIKSKRLKVEFQADKKSRKDNKEKDVENFWSEKKAQEIKRMFEQQRLTGKSGKGHKIELPKVGKKEDRQE